MIPIKESLIYVQPLYLRAETGKIPELKRVIVAAENRIAMEPTLEAGLARIFGNASSAAETWRKHHSKYRSRRRAWAKHPPHNQRQTLMSPAAQAMRHYDRARFQAQREGDWTRYGEEIKRLGAAIEQISKQR